MKLKSLKGVSREIAGDFNFNCNQISNLDFAPLKVGGNIYCRDNKLNYNSLTPEEYAVLMKNPNRLDKLKIIDEF